MAIKTEDMQDDSRIVLREQEYWCNNCKLNTTSVGLPRGWYMIKKAADPNDAKTKPGTNLRTVSILCSLKCIMMDTTNELFRRVETNNTKY